MKLEKTARIGIVGAGCAGLSCAEELRERGYRNVTVLEGKRRVGGKVFTIHHRTGGQTVSFEGGAVWFVPGPICNKYIKRYGISTEYRVLPPAHLFDMDSGRSCNPIALSNGQSFFSRISQLLQFLGEMRKHGAPDAPGFNYPIYREMATPSPEWFTSKGLEFAREAFVPIANAAAFGFTEPNISAGYVMKLLGLLNRFTLLEQMRVSLPQLREGNQELWTRVAARHDLRLGATVRRVSRHQGTACVQTTAGDFEFDTLVWTAPVDDFLRVADATQEEWDVFSRVRHIKRAVVTCTAEGLPPNLFLVVKNTLDGGVPRSYPHVAYEVPHKSGVYNFYPYPGDDTSPAELEENVRDLVHRLGGRNVSLLQPPLYWKWFPHFSPQDVGDGIFERAEMLQGRRSTWFAGELFAGIGVAYGTEYAAHLVERMLARQEQHEDAGSRRPSLRMDYSSVNAHL